METGNAWEALRTSGESYCEPGSESRATRPESQKISDASRKTGSPAISSRANQLWRFSANSLSLDLMITSQVERERDQVPIPDRLA